MTPREVEAEILRLFDVEKWKVGTIARQLGVHHDVVERVLAQEGTPRPQPVHASMIEPFVSFIREKWEKYPRLPASRLYVMCRERGYPGKLDHFRHSAKPYRPRPAAEAFLRLQTLPGEQAQADWGCFGRIAIGAALRFLVAFVLVLSWSRAIFLRFYLGMQTENFLRGHQDAMERWGGISRVVLYDNLKSAVLERVGGAIRFNPLLVDFSAHYRFEPRPVGLARGNEKGRVERAIRYVRTSFFMARKWRNIADLNAQADAWCTGEAMDRPWPQDRTRTVRQAFEEEQGRLFALPTTPYPVEECKAVGVSKTPYVRFDRNDYSVPHTLVRTTVTVRATPEEVRVLVGREEVARHRRCYDKGKQIEDPAHLQGLIAAKREGREHRAMDRLAHAAPSSSELLVRLAERGKNLGYTTRVLLALLDLHGADALDGAIREVLASEAPHVHGVRLVLEREREARGLPPRTPLALPDDPRLRDLRAKPHDLGGYDALGKARTDGASDADDGGAPCAAAQGGGS